MTGRGRPLRFLGAVLALWVGVRIVMLQPDRAVEGGATATAGTRARGVLLPRSVRDTGATRKPAQPIRAIAGAIEPARTATVLRARHLDTSPTGPATLLPLAGMGASVLSTDADTPAATPPEVFERAPTLAPQRGMRPGRIHGDTWLVARPRGADSLAFGQLGASQAGARITIGLDAARRIALSTRFSTPLAGRGQEVAVGLDWRTPLPLVHLLAEARVPVEGGAAQPAVQLIASAARRLPLGLGLQGYAQAGAVGRRGAFADGSALLDRALLHRAAARLAFGAGLWGAAQRGVARVDIGPELSVSVPSRGGTVRLALDYRARVAGSARPGSGPALTLGSSF